MHALPALIITRGASLIRSSLTVLLPANTLQSTGTSLSPVQPEVARHTWPVLSAWKPVNSTIQ